MDGVHDLGGMHGFGRVPVEANEPVFHARWEGRVFGMMGLLAARGLWPIDAHRHAIECLEPTHYLSASYYERWRAATEMLLRLAGLLTAEELEERLQDPRSRATRTELPSAEPGAFATGYIRELGAPPRFSRGERVRARNIHPAGHTRSPRYVRGRRGVVTRVHPAHVFPDTQAHGKGECPQYLYTVRFEGAELWGETADARSSVQIDLFESYLEPEQE